MAGTREYVAYASHLTELVDMPRVYVEQIKC